MPGRRIGGTESHQPILRFYGVRTESIASYGIKRRVRQRQKGERAAVGERADGPLAAGNERRSLKVGTHGIEHFAGSARCRYPCRLSPLVVCDQDSRVVGPRRTNWIPKILCEGHRLPTRYLDLLQLPLDKESNPLPVRREEGVVGSFRTRYGPDRPIFQASYVQARRCAERGDIGDRPAVARDSKSALPYPDGSGARKRQRCRVRERDAEMQHSGRAPVTSARESPVGDHGE